MGTAGLEAIALVREVREEARNLQAAVARVLEAYAKDDMDAMVATERAQATLDANGGDLHKRLCELKEHLAEHPRLRDSLGDHETRLRNLWDEAYGDWTRGGGKPNLPIFRAVQRTLDQLILEAAYVTIPPRLDQNLDNIRIGGALNFHSEFEDEVSSKEHREKVLGWIHSHAAAVAGIVDLEHAVVYKAHRSRGVRALTLIFIAGVATISFLAPFLRDWLDLKGSLVPSVNAEDLAKGYVFALAGLFLHVLIAAWKEMKAAAEQGTSPPTLGNWFLWLHVRYLPAAAALLWVLAAVFMAAAATKQTEWLTMLAIGYSADSIADLALPKIASLMNKRSEVIV